MPSTNTTAIATQCAESSSGNKQISVLDELKCFLNSVSTFIDEDNKFSTLLKPVRLNFGCTCTTLSLISSLQKEDSCTISIQTMYFVLDHYNYIFNLFRLEKEV